VSCRTLPHTESPLDPQSQSSSHVICERHDAGQRLCPASSDDGLATPGTVWPLWPPLPPSVTECPVDQLYRIGNIRPRMDPLVKRLRQLRAARGLSQEALARKAHVSRGYLARIELGRHDPTLGVLRRLAKGLRVSAAELVK